MELLTGSLRLPVENTPPDRASGAGPG
jgi:hypothetical protein